MTLSEIETTVQELATRHGNLTEEMLTTLLLSAGWEDKNIKDAVMLFKHNNPSIAVVDRNSKDIPEPSQIKSQSLTEGKQSADKQAQLVTHSLAQDTSLLDKKESKEKEIDTLLSPDGDIVAPVHNENNEVSPQAQSQAKEVVESPVVLVESQLLHASNEVTAKDVSFASVDVSIPSSTIAHEVSETHNEDVVRESLVVHTEPLRARTSTAQAKLPDNLPLLPFESSPHVWSFSKYKDVFHPDETHPLPFEIAGHSLPEMHRSSELFNGEKATSVVAEKLPVEVISQHSFESSAPSDVLPLPESVTGESLPEEVVLPQEFSLPVDETPPALPPIADDEVTFEKIPLTKGDESLVFLAGVMLLVIILILGYMYSNGRL